MPIITLNTITNIRISIGKTIVCGYVTKQTVPPHQPLPVSLEIYRNTRITCIFLKADQTDGSFCKFVFVVHTERLSVHVALFYPCHVGDWDSTCRHNICFQTAYTRCKFTNIMVGLTLYTCHWIFYITDWLTLSDCFCTETICTKFVPLPNFRWGVKNTQNLSNDRYARI
jgi:hypothetical protein